MEISNIPNWINNNTVSLNGIPSELISDFEDILNDFSSCASYTSPSTLALSVFVYDIEQVLPRLYTEMQGLKTEDPKAYKACQPILGFLTESVSPGLSSILSAAENSDSLTLAIDLITLNSQGLLTSKNGLCGLMTAFENTFFPSK